MSRQPARRRPPPLPPQPEQLRDGLCVTHGDPGIWAAEDRAGRAAAVLACLACPALAPCRSWSLSIRTADDQDLILGGLLPAARAAIRRDRLAAPPA